MLNKYVPHYRPAHPHNVHCTLCEAFARYPPYVAKESNQFASVLCSLLFHCPGRLLSHAPPIPQSTPSPPPAITAAVDTMRPPPRQMQMPLLLLLPMVPSSSSPLGRPAERTSPPSCHVPMRSNSKWAKTSSCRAMWSMQVILRIGRGGWGELLRGGSLPRSVASVSVCEIEQDRG